MLQGVELRGERLKVDMASSGLYDLRRLDVGAFLEDPSQVTLTSTLSALPPEDLFHFVGEVQRAALTSPELIRDYMRKSSTLGHAVLHALYLLNLQEDTRLYQNQDEVTRYRELVKELKAELEQMYPPFPSVNPNVRGATRGAASASGSLGQIQAPAPQPA